MEELGQIIASNLIFLRKNASLTQLEFGERFNYTDKTVSRWESGTVIPSVEVLKQIADFYGVTVDYLLTEHKSIKEFNSVIKKTINAKNKVILIALIVTVVWFVAMTIYVASIYNFGTANPDVNHYWSSFLWAVPISFIIISFGTRRWFKGSTWYYVFASCFVWSALLAAFLTFLYINAYWYLFFIGVPIQVAIVLLAKLKS